MFNEATEETIKSVILSRVVGNVYSHRGSSVLPILLTCNYLSE